MKQWTVMGFCAIGFRADKTVFGVDLTDPLGPT